MPPLRSMTGFGAAQAEGAGFSALVEVKSVNHRGLKLSVKARPPLGLLEKDIRDRAASVLSRGAVDVSVVLRRAGAPLPGGDQLEAARARVDAVRALAAALGVPGELTIRDLLTLPGFWDGAGDEDRVSDAEAGIVLRALDDALRQTAEMRTVEGAALARVLAGLAGPVEDFRAAAEATAGQVAARAREKIQARLREWFPGGLTGGDSQALEREAAFAADKADIREELDRLASHLVHYRDALAAGGQAGKRLEFLAQEMLREVNTAACKAQDAETSALAVSAKLAIERIKEQAANVE